MLVRPQRVLSVLPVVFLLCLVSFYFHLANDASCLRSQPTSNPPNETRPAGNLVYIPKEGYPSLKPSGSNYSHILVLAKTEHDDIQWIHDELPDMPLAVYEVDKPNAPLTVPKNKGKEATVYLTYIIDHYDDLPDIVLFFHAHRYAWHNNILLNQDAALTLKRLNLERVARMGYMNSRCEHKPGCPDWIHIDRPEVDWDFFRKPEEPHFTKAIWREVFPGIPPPPALAAQCCAQFMVTRERIRGVPRERYEFIRKWLLNTNLEDQLSGRVLEYTWHYIFTDAVREFEKLKKQEAEASEEEERERIAKRKAELQGIIAKLDETLNNGKADAYVRGEDPKMRGLERERWKEILSGEQPVPKDTLFDDGIFVDACRNLENKNESRIIQDISRFIVPSAESLALRNKNYKRLVKSVNERWNSIPLNSTRPPPDYSVGFRRDAFTEDQPAKLSPFIGDFIAGDQSLFMARYYIHFPFLTWEVKCGAAALDIVNRQNAYSMTLAVRGIVELFRTVKREDEVNRKMLAFSISYDH
ncbi:hypothetical protein VTI74DRAFT_1895 [Chaetomium olivicolor]